MKELTFVGLFQDKSKKGNDYGIAYFTGEPDDRIKDRSVGVIGLKFFVMGDNLDVLKTLKVGSKVHTALHTYKNDKGEYVTNLVAVQP